MNIFPTPFRIAIAGLGTVGTGTIEVLASNAPLIAERCGRPIEIVAVSARSAKPRGVDLSPYRFEQDAHALAELEVDCVVEVIGGSEGVARELVETALKKGKSVVTANKALIAHHGVSLAKLAEESGATLAFEAAVAGGIPIIKSLRDGLAANHFTRIAGILNGTCNYILTQMWEHKQDFETVLAEAQALGYAEADPGFDVDGIDASHKIAILASLAFGTAPAIDHVYVEGIRHISLRDMEYAHELGYCIKLLAIAELNKGGVVQRVHPCMVPVSSPLGAVHGVYNAVMAEGDAVGSVFFEGRGAGAGPTGSSVAADIMDIARGVKYKPFTLPVSSLAQYDPVPLDRVPSAYYLRLQVIDRPGVLAQITGAFAGAGISVRSFLQHSHQPGESVPVVLTTHPCMEGEMKQAVQELAQSPSLVQPPRLIRIVEG